MTWLIAGLGNPGAKYARNRHNVGFMVVEELARGAGMAAWKPNKLGAEATTGMVAGTKVVLVKPQEFMNTSGFAVQRAMAFHDVDVAKLVVVHDEIDLDFGIVRVKQGGGHGGHNGIKSIFELVGRDFDHLRMGVGRPNSTDPDVVADYVLDRFAEPRAEVDDLVRRAADAVELWVAEGVETAMNQVNAG